VTLAHTFNLTFRGMKKTPDPFSDAQLRVYTAGKVALDRGPLTVRQLLKLSDTLEANSVLPEPPRSQGGVRRKAP
jgi:hypothetical protein